MANSFGGCDSPWRLRVSAVLTATIALVAAVPTKDNDRSCGKSNMFWYGPKSVCLPHGGPKDNCDPPPQQNCGKKWYWHKDLKCCVPREPDCKDAGCEDGWKWDDDKYSCVPDHGSEPDKCGPSYFWWAPKSKCMPHGGPSHPSYPPKGKKCPKKWSWREEGYCVPSEPDYGKPECDDKYSWDEGALCCKSKDY